MAARRKEEPKPAVPRRNRAKTPDGEEIRMSALAIDAAERMLRSENPPAQIVTHYLKASSSRERLEKERLQTEVTLLRAKQAQIESQARQEELFEKVVRAMKRYSGEEDYGELDED